MPYVTEEWLNERKQNFVRGKRAVLLVWAISYAVPVILFWVLWNMPLRPHGRITLLVLVGLLGSFLTFIGFKEVMRINRALRLIREIRTR
jgi:hypothetical protein